MRTQKRTARKQGSGRKNPHKTGRRHGTRAGNKATERGCTSGKSRTQPPGGSAGQTKNGGQPAGWEQGSDTPAEKTPEHRSQKPSQQRLAAQERPARHMARHIGRRKTPPNRQNTRSLFCLPGGPCEPGPPKNASLFWLARSFCCALLMTARFARVLRRAALRHQRGRRPLSSPASFLKKA